MHVRSAQAIGAAIRSRRRELKLDQAELALRVGATRQWVIAIEKGKNTAEIGMILRALAALGLELDLRPIEVATTKATRTTKKLPTIDLDAIVDRAKGKGRPRHV
jgi:HTH-type transcriptional regulator / antitoxin HipB